MNIKAEPNKKNRMPTNIFATTNKNMKRSHSSELLATHQPKTSQFKRLSSTQVFSFSQSKSICTLKKKSKKNLATSETKTIKKKKKAAKDHEKRKRKGKKSKEAKRKELEDKQQELTERKKFHLEYFLFKNVYVPIQNTEQRKLAYKIQLINTQPFLSLQEKGVNTEQPITKEASTNIEQVQNNQMEIQTQNMVRLSSEDSDRNLISVLSELEFFYLPDKRNFEGFTKHEKLHYRELFMDLAKKFEENDEPQLDEDKIQVLMYQRECMQMGTLQSDRKQGFSTSISAIFSYLSQLFCHIQLKQKASTIERINSRYGYSCLEKLKLLRLNKSTKIIVKLLPDSTFRNVQEDLFEGYQFESQLMEEALHYHNKAVFDLINEFLCQLQPYYSSNGECLPWSKKNLGITFYAIDEDSFDNMVIEIKNRVYETVNTLAGLLLDTGEQRYRIHIHKILQNEKKMIEKLIKSENYDVQLEEETTKMLFIVSQLIVGDLMSQIREIGC